MNSKDNPKKLAFLSLVSASIMMLDLTSEETREYCQYLIDESHVYEKELKDKEQSSLTE